MTRRLLLLVLVAVLLASPAAAQGSDPFGTVSVAAGVGVSRSEHTDLRFAAASWEADLLLRLSNVTSFEVAIGQWRHTETFTVRDVPIQGPSGVIGRADRLDQATERVTTTFEGNYLARIGMGRARVLAGGGVGVMVLGRTFRQSFSGCSASIPNACGTFEQHSATASGMAQGVAMVEVPVSGPVSVYGAFRVLLPMRDVGLLTTRGTVGVRLSFGG